MSRLKRATVLPLVLLMLLLPCKAALADEAPYRSYTYDRFHNAVPSPNGYLPGDQLFGSDLGVGDLNNPNDLFVDKERNELYIVDTGNKRIVVVDEHYRLIRVITEFDNDGEAVTLNIPMGIFVDKDGTMYITDQAEQGDGRVIVSDKDLKVKHIFGKPQSDLITENFHYKPSKIVVDRYGKIYIQATDVTQGLFCLTPDGTFLNYFGSNKVEMDARKLILQLWRKLLPREASQSIINFIPIEYSNIYIDDTGFIYATAAASTTYEYQVMSLNPLGSDVLRWRRLDWFEGSNFKDIYVDEYGFITAIDQTRGKVFQVEPDEGTMMFTFGGIGNMAGLFTRPVAIEGFNGKILVLDSEKRAITEFELTTFGKAVREAQVLYMEGKYIESIEPWLEVVKRNSNYLFAYVGLGKAYYQLEDYQTAMKYFKLGYNKEHYSEALREYSLIAMRSNFGYIVLGIGILIALIVVTRMLKRKRVSIKLGGAV